jgi:hypothetical protein
MKPNKKNNSRSSQAPRVIIACHVLEPEIEKLRPYEKGIEVRYVEQGLHETPDKMPGIIQEEIDRTEGYTSKIVLGYGLCSNGIVGIKAPKQGLIVPKVHDCIALFLGSHEMYKTVFHNHPGTFYLTSGWIAENADPLGWMEEKYVPRYGREMAEWALKEELKNYTHIALINMKIGNLAPLRERALENARFLELKYEEIDGSLELLKKIVFGPYEERDFFFFQPGEIVSQNPFLDLPSSEKKKVAN